MRTQKERLIMENEKLIQDTENEEFSFDLYKAE